MKWEGLEPSGSRPFNLPRGGDPRSLDPRGRVWLKQPRCDSRLSRSSHREVALAHLLLGLRVPRVTIGSLAEIIPHFVADLHQFWLPGSSSSMTWSLSETGLSSPFN